MPFFALSSLKASPLTTHYSQFKPHDEKTTSPGKAMHRMWATIYLAQKMGKSMGGSKVLQ
jgi:hypothetical protein